MCCALRPGDARRTRSAQPAGRRLRTRWRCSRSFARSRRRVSTTACRTTRPAAMSRTALARLKGFERDSLRSTIRSGPSASASTTCWCSPRCAAWSSSIASCKPWERDPAFYSTTDLGFGPKMHRRDARFPSCRCPTEGRAALIARQARGRADDSRAGAQQSHRCARRSRAARASCRSSIERNVYDQLARDLARIIRDWSKSARARAMPRTQFIAWLKRPSASCRRMAASAGGIRLVPAHVLLFPYTWDEMRIIARARVRALARRS